MSAIPTAICISQSRDPNWRWVESGVPRVRFEFYKVCPENWLEERIQRPLIARYRAVAQGAYAARKRSAPVVVSHLPLMTAWTQLGLSAARAPSAHLAFAFNFTSLPQGRRRKALVRALKGVDRFVVPSTMERRLYANHFDIPEERIDVLLWGSGRPQVPTDVAPVVQGDYLCAVGGEVRDYRMLMQAIDKLPHIPLVVVVRPHSLNGIHVPSHVKVLVNAPLAQAEQVVQNARGSIVPLRHSEVPCGHVTMVKTMYMKTPLIVTEGEGVQDYVTHGDNALLTPPGDPAALAQVIEQLWDDPALGTALAERGERFAETHCAEQATVDYFDRYLTQIGV